MRFWRSAATAAALLSIAAGALAIGWNLAVEIAGLRASTRALPPDPIAERGSVLMANGIDQGGRTVDRMPLGTNRMVVFVLYGPEISTTVAFWQRMRQGAPPGTFFLGICGDQACAAAAAPAHAGFPIIVDGEVVGIRVATRAARAGRFFVTDNRARVLAVPAVRSTPKDTRAEIEGAR